VKPALEPTRPSSDIDDLKAFIRRLEAFEHETGDLVPDREPEPVAEPAGQREEPAVPVPREVPEITIRPGILAARPVPEKGTAPAAAPADTAQKPEPPRFGEPREVDRKVERRPVILSETRPGAEKPAPEVIIQWKKDEPLSGAAAGPAEGTGMVQPEPPRRRPVILKREIDIRRVERRPERPRAAAPLLEERKIDKIMRQPGVIAVSVFQEGFAVQSVGRADFDQVAANAEDLLRAGTKIASDISIGSLQQIILESQGGKLIISPYGDLNICIFTEADANLGLIRVAIRSIQTE
jgi:predicted regulator of Ras-like GTPase activity (Roadblock/LC7/MglB family)